MLLVTGWVAQRVALRAFRAWASVPTGEFHVAVRSRSGGGFITTDGNRCYRLFVLDIQNRIFFFH